MACSVMGNFDKSADFDFQNQPVMPAIPPEQTIMVFDLGPHGGDPTKIELDPLSAREYIERGAGRYVMSLPPGSKQGA